MTIKEIYVCGKYELKEEEYKDFSKWLMGLGVEMDFLDDEEINKLVEDFRK